MLVATVSVAVALLLLLLLAAVATRGTVRYGTVHVPRTHTVDYVLL